MTGLSPALRLVQEFGVGTLAGFATGALVGGLGSRIVMRISGFAAGPGAIGQLTENGNVVGAVTLGGTLSLVSFIAISGAIGGSIYVALQPWLAPLGRWRGLGFGLLILVAAGGGIDPGNADFSRFGSPLLNVLMFMALFPLGGIVLGWLAAALERYAAADSSQPRGVRRAAIDTLIWIAGIGGLLLLGVLIVGNLAQGISPALIPMAMLALALGTRFYLAYAGDRTSLGARLRMATAVLILALMVAGLARTASGIAEILR